MENKINHNNKITVLGSGTSTGNPIPCCHCSVCDSGREDPSGFNNRLRTSLLLSTKLGKKILIDTTPDFRTQALRESIEHIDAAIITHDHADHVHGIDDLRPFSFNRNPKTIDVFTSQYCAGRLRKRFDYIFNPTAPSIGGGIPQLRLCQVQESIDQNSLICDEIFIFFHLPHGHITTLGFVHQSFAYLPDCHEVPKEIVNSLKESKLEVLIIDCVRQKLHSSHLHFEASLEYIEKIAPKKAYLIHMSHDFDHDKLQQELKDRHLPHVEVSYDGMGIEYT